MQNEEIKVDIHGSCISFNVIKKDTSEGDNWKLSGVKNGLYYSHVNIAGSVGKPINPLPEPQEIDCSEHFKRNLITDLKKEAIHNLEQSDAEWLLIDLYDMARVQWAYQGGSFTHTFLLNHTAKDYYKKIQDQIEGYFRWIDIPKFLCYENIDKYMDRIIKKYGNDHVILNRVYYNQYYIDHDHTMHEIGGNIKFYGGYPDNAKVRALEEYVINKWKIRSIDVAKYFVSDIKFGGDVLSVHYEREYYRLAGRILQVIINGDNDIDTDHIDLEALEYKLNRCAQIQSGDSNGYLSCAEQPFDYYEPLDEIIKSLSMNQIGKCNKTIIYLYRYVESYKEFYKYSKATKEQIQEELLNLFDELLIRQC